MKEQLSECYLPYPGRGKRRVRVFVPEHADGARLPVVYMTDGQNIFDEESSTWGCWYTREAVREAMQHGMSGAVIVGIDHGGKWRDNELTPASIGEVIGGSEMENFTRPEGEIFDRFVAETVMPYVEAHYPVKQGRAYTAFCGSSSGGLQSIFTALEHSDKFSMAGVFSPAMLLYRGEDIRAWLLSKLGEEPPYLYFYTGCGDPLEERIYQGTEMTYDILMEIGYPYDKMNEVVMPGYEHNEAAWAEIFRDFLHTFLSGNV